MKKKMKQRILSIVLSVALLLSVVPMTVFAAEDTAGKYYDRVSDASTMDNWTKYFDLDHLDTTNAGGVWTDKSVFTDASAFNGKISMDAADENFLTALSALAANKEIVGYSTVPTDTVLVLDLSGSMANSNSEAQLINAANDAIAELLEVNKNNRVGVVMYSASTTAGSSTYAESVTRILPIDRYTTAADGVYLSLSGNGRVSVDRDVAGTVANADLDNAKSFGGGTYIQAGLWEAMEMFKEMDTVIGDNNWQSGDNRMPILVLMSDGAPSTGTSYYDDVKNSRYTTGNYYNQITVYESNVGNGNESGLTEGNAFLTQLTASYVMNQIEAHYQKIDPDVRGLFYTLGFNIGTNSIAQSVMNPDASTETDALWNTYNALTNGSMSVRVKSRNANSTSYTEVSIAKNSYATSKSYVDRYFSASGTGLTDAFTAIVDEIILQSRYYPTHLEGGNPDFSGYVEFEDTIGEYMEVKGIKGILLGNTLYDGHMMASKLGEDGLGTPENPTDLGNEFIWSVKSRLGIAETADAQALVANAYAAGQLKYVSDTDWSNYIGWYAKADGTYVGFWDENAATAAPADAVYKMKSYGFLGETTGSIKNSDMMYMTVQVRTDIATGEQTVIWKIPAALVPMVTYLVTLEGTNVDEARNVTVRVEDTAVTPIRLVFESGLRSDLNALNITRIADEKHVAADGVTRQFWTNHFDISAPTHDEHITTVSEFTPSKENERFYYTFDSAVHKLVGGQYVLVQNETLDENGEYYHRRYVFKEGASEPVFLYERMSAASVKVAKDHGWDANFETLDGTKGAYVVPAGTPARELKMYDEQKAANPTESAHMVFHPYLTEQNNIFYVDMNLGNNGRLRVTPAQGIKLSKTVDIVEAGTSTDFAFLVTVHNANGTPFTGVADSWITPLDEVPTGDATAADFTANGTYLVNLSADETLWLTALPAGATYTVEEVSANDDYKVKSVHVNGISTGTVADGTVAAYYIDDVDFVNTAVGEGDLVITKQVVDANGNTVDVNDNITFTAEVTLTDAAGNPVSGTFAASNAAGSITVPANGKFTVSLTDGTSFVVRNIPEETRYTVVETNIPAGFALDAARSELNGVVDDAANDRALIVNTYTPTGTNGQNVTVEVTKDISGNRTTWLNGESYTFEVRSQSGVIGQFTIDSADADKKQSVTLSAENYTAAGTYHYTVVEPAGAQGGITYDTAQRRFAVVVADADMDGDLEIIAVNNEANTTVTAAGGNYTVAAVFNNVYQPTGSATVTIKLEKRVSGDTRLNGYRFALFDSADIANANEIMRSTVSDAMGNATFTLTYAPNRATMAGVTYTYYMAELNTGNPNITYDPTVYKVDVTVKDNGDGTISATPVISGLPAGEDHPIFVNTFTPSASAYVTLTAEKMIEGDRVLNANEFTFVLEPLTAGAPMPAATSVKNAANGAVVFDAIEFTAEGTYKYKLYESNADAIGGFAYDSRFYEITVTVVDNGNATLSATVQRVRKANAQDTGYVLPTGEDILFVNMYDATDATVTLSGDKLLTGKDLQANEFTFVLTPDNAAYPMPSVNTASNDANGNFAFPEITFNKAGVYTYTVTEQATSDARYDFDTAVYAVTVTVTDNSRGILTAEVTLKKDGLDASAIVFRNGFVPTPLTYDITAKYAGNKVLHGRPLEAGEFSFTLINAINGAQIGEAVENDANGVFTFPAVTLPEAGTYHYKIAEVVGDEKGVSYDPIVFHVVVGVVQNADGSLAIVREELHKATVTKEEVGGVLTEVTKYEDITAAVGAMTFNNTYKADPAHVTLEAMKTLTGRDLVDGEFKFDLHETDDTFAYSENTVLQDDVVLVLEDDGSGHITFMPLTFDAVGTYHYVIVEDELDEKGITADKSVYKVEITVTDNHDGNLVAAVKVNGTDISGSTAATVQFANTYKAAATEIVIEGTKTLTGRELKAEEFSFELYDAQGVKLETVKNAENGKFAFTAIPVDTAGVYKYTVKEFAGTDATITYDAAVYTVTATVTDNLDGTFTVQYAYEKDATTVQGLTFVNTYTAPPAPPAPIPNPETGDHTQVGLLAALLFVSGGLMGFALFGKKRKEQENA